jgi:hypothetical protein
MKGQRDMCAAVVLSDDVWPPEIEIGSYTVRKHLRK